MRVLINNGGQGNAGNQHLLTFRPDTDEDRVALKNFADSLKRVHIVSCRGFEYMTSDVEFLVQPMPGRD